MLYKLRPVDDVFDFHCEQAACCKVCGMKGLHVSEQALRSHIRSKRHQAALKKKNEDTDKPAK